VMPSFSSVDWTEDGVGAGIDMFMGPYSYQAFETTLIAGVEAG
jgi:hypothetical protein